MGYRSFPKEEIFAERRGGEFEGLKPISLVWSFYKIIAMVLANRLEKSMWESDLRLSKCLYGRKEILKCNSYCQSSH